VKNLPKVVAQQRRGRASNPRLLDRNSDALPLSHRATPSRHRGSRRQRYVGLPSRSCTLQTFESSLLWTWRHNFGSEDLSHNKFQQQRSRTVHINKRSIKPPPRRSGHVFLFVCLSVPSFVCCQRVLVGHWPDWPSSTMVLAAVSGRSAAGPVRPVFDILVAAGAYLIGHSGRTHLLYSALNNYQTIYSGRDG